jgi:Ca2+-binding RTX toxin-like protein
MAELTAHEQLLLELINRARLDPAGEAARYGIDLNQGLPAGTLSAAHKQPLAPNPNLATAAQNHSQWQLDTDTFSHTGSGGSNAGDRMRAAGYVFTGSWSWGENISWRGTSGTLNLTNNIYSHHEGLFKSAGHRENILGDYRELGIGVRTGTFEGYNASMATENFARSGTGQFITGVAFFDANSDKFYNVGEGRGGVRLDARNLSNGSVTTVTTASAGGYATKLASANYELTFSGGGITAAMGVLVTLGALNIKVDVAAADGIATNVSATLTGAGKSLTLLGIDNVNGTGNGQANQIVGNKGGNELNGAAGADTLTGGGGNDVFVVKAGEANGDVIADFTGNGASSGDTIRFEGYGDGASLQHVSGNQWRVVGGSAVDTVTIVGAVGAGDYSFIGGGGGPPPEEPVTGTDGDDVLIGTAVADLLGGGLGNDSEAGAGGNDWLYGGDGNDTLEGGAGIDSMRGGGGNDIYIVDSLADFIQETGDVGDDDAVWSALTIDLGNDARFANVENARLLGAGAAAVIGDNGTNRLEGNTASNFLAGAADDDTLIGGAGNDTLDGGDGVDTLVGGAGNDLYVLDEPTEDADVVELAGEGTDTVQSLISATLAANVENLVLLGSANSGEGNSLANRITGNSEDNELDGAGGNDTLMGGAGDDEYSVDAFGDVVGEAAGQGTDTVFSKVSWTLGANLENLTLTDAAALNGIGNTSVNTIIGNASDNLLRGGAGNDTLQADGGSDTLDGGAGADAMNGGAGNDTYVIDDIDTDGAGSDAGDSITDSGGIDTIKTLFAIDLGAQYANFENAVLLGKAAVNAAGSAAANLLVGNGAANQLAGLAGNDALDGGAGRDTLIGGAGDDRYVVDNALDVIIENAGEGADTVQSFVSHTLGATLEHLVLAGAAAINGIGNAAGNSIAGNNAANKLSGLDGNDTLAGNGGNDVLDGGSGNDAMAGGLGNDLFVVDSASDTVTEADGEGVDTVQSSLVSTSLGGFVENLTLLVGAANGTGNDLNNLILGNGDANALDGGAGNDTLGGGAGDDTLTGAAGIDRMAGGLGNDLFHVDSSSDIVIEAAGQGVDSVVASASFVLGGNLENLALAGGAGDINGTGNALANLVTGNEGDNKLAGGAGNDTLSGGDGLDTLDGGAGNDSMSGGAGDDTYVVNAVGDVIVENGGAGTDTVQSVITYTLGATLENLTLLGAGAINGTGNDGDNSITGNGAANRLGGGDGADTLRGGAGNDILTGGEGSDTFIRALNSDGRDAVTDFTLGAGGDKLDVSDVLIGYDLSDNAAEFVQLVASNGNTTVRIDANGAVGGAQFADAFVLVGVTATDANQLIGDGNLILQ